MGADDSVMVVNPNIDPDKLPDRTKAGWPRNNSVDNALCALRQIAMTVKRGPKRKILFRCPGIQFGHYLHCGDWEWFSPRYDGPKIQRYVGAYAPYDPTLKAIHKAMQVLADGNEG